MNLYVVIALVVIVMVLVITNIQIVPQARTFVLERLGTYITTWQT